MRIMVAWFMASIGFAVGWALASALRSRRNRRKGVLQAMKKRRQLRCVMRMLAEGTDRLHVDGDVARMTPHGLHLALTTLLEEGDLLTTDLLQAPAEEHKRLIRAAAQQWVAFEAQRRRPQ